jgi:hypothetical protein
MIISSETPLKSGLGRIIHMWHYYTGKAFLDRLPHDGDLLVSSKEALKKSSVKTGFFVAIGAVKYARIEFTIRKIIHIISSLWMDRQKS